MLYIVLLHYPVYNKEGKIVTTAIANMDIHDIARLAKTYGAQGFYIVNPILEQRNLAQEIISHWREGYGAHYNKFRQAAFEAQERPAPVYPPRGNPRKHKYPPKYRKVPLLF